MENTTHLFLAMRFNCNKCHDHPFERWTQDQYYHWPRTSPGRAEGGSRIRRARRSAARGGRGPSHWSKSSYDKGLRRSEARAHRRGRPAGFPYSTSDIAAGRRLAPRATGPLDHSPENPYFAKSYVNRLWGYLFGGDHRADRRYPRRQSADESRTARCADRTFIESGFDVQHMLRTICKSRTYQHSIATNEWNEDDTINYSHAVPRRLPAEVLYDAIHLRRRRMPPAGRARRVPGGSTSRRRRADPVPRRPSAVPRARAPASANAPTAWCWGRS
jgi:hypothetical protein